MPTPAISSFVIQLVNADGSFSALAASSADLFITDGNPLGAVEGRAFSDANVAALQAQGRIVAGYVNVSVTDDFRYYWQPNWTSNQHDTGTPILGQAPVWLSNGKPLDFTGDSITDAYIVEYWNSDWQQIVLAQVGDLVSRGYKAIFLDDVGRYFQSSRIDVSVAQAADLMIDLISLIRSSIPSDVVLIANADPYITANSSAGVAGARGQAYLSAIDFQLIENQGLATYNDTAVDLPGEPLLVLQSSNPNLLTASEGWARGILYNSPANAYNSFVAETAYPATNGNDTLKGGVGPNQINGMDGMDTLLGLGGDDSLIGGVGNDYLIGGEGADQLFGGTGSNTLQGGLGDDLYIVETAGDSIVEFANEGTDEIRTSLSVYSMANHIETLTYTGGNVPSVLVGSATDNSITGGTGRDELFGGAGDDILNDGGNGSGNADTLIGGTGGDQYVVSERGTSTIELPGAGYDTVRTAFSIYALQANIEALAATDNGPHLALVGNDIRNEIAGGTGRDNIFGRAGNDVLDGGTGDANTLLGQEGDDDYLVHAIGDSVIEFAGEGNDRVLSFVQSFVLPANVERLVSGVQDSFTGIGNALDNEVRGWSWNDFLSGLDGNDTMIGADGADTMLGGSGSDTFLYMGFETGLDRILDFTSGQDRISLHASSYTRTVTVDFIQAGAPTASSANSTFLYNVNTGIVSYDADGTGAGAAIQLAQLNAGLMLTAGDFVFY